jgi:hypothetical protein
VIAERLERIMASTDCGFGTVVGDTQVSEDVVWANLATCATVPPSQVAGSGLR